MRKKIALISGITGQDGFYLTKLLLEKNYEVHGIVRRIALEDPEHRLWRLRPFLDRITLHAGSLESYASLFNIVEKVKPDECYHLAAMSFVSYSFEDEFSTINTNINGTLFMLSAIRNKAPNCKFYFAACYDYKTNIVTRDGIKKYNELKVGDEIYTVNIKTNQIELKPIKKMLVYNYNDKMIKFNGKRLDLLVTPNHKMLLNNNGNLFYENAENISTLLKHKETRNLYFPKPTWNGINKKYINFHEYINFDHIAYNTVRNLLDNMEMKDYLYLLGLYIGDGYTNKYKYKCSMSAKEFIKRRKVNGQFKKSNKKYKTITYSGNCIFFAIPKNDKARKNIIRVLNKYKINFKTTDNSIYFSSVILKYMFKQSGNNVYEKCIPKWTLNLSTHLLKFLYNGLIDSDGCWRKERNSEGYVTVSKNLAHGFIELCVKLGYDSHIIYCKKSKVFFKKGNRFFNSKPYYKISINHNQDKKIYKHHISNVNYSGKVWCLEMVDNNNFLIERNGYVYFCGNSSEMFGKVREVPQTENTPFHPRSPYGISKVAGFDLTRNYRESYNLFACNGILFNHESKMRGCEFVTRKITSTVAKIKLGLVNELKLGNLEAKRDWGFAGDYVEAMHLMLQQDKADDYVIATNETHSVQEFVELAFRYADLDWRKYVKIDKQFIRPAEVNLLIGDYSKAKRVLNWQPKIKFKELVREMVESDIRLLEKIVHM